MKTIRVAFILSAFSFILLSFVTPEGWLAAGSEKKSYKMGIDPEAGHSGNNAATIQSKSAKIKGYGTLMQNSLPDKYLGKRVRMTGYLKSENVAEWAGLWLRVDQSASNYALSFDNMKDRSITGTTEWTKYEIVLDVPLTATNLAYGALISGTGKIWFDDITFEVVDKSISTTGENQQKYMPQTEPSNLSFEK